MVMRILDHGNDADARLVAIMMHKLKLEAVTVTNEDDAAMLHDIEGKCLVAFIREDKSGMELRFVDDEDLPGDEDQLN